MRFFLINSTSVFWMCVRVCVCVCCNLNLTDEQNFKTTKGSNIRTRTFVHCAAQRHAHIQPAISLKKIHMYVATWNIFKFFLEPQRNISQALVSQRGSQTQKFAPPHQMQLHMYM